MRNTVCNGSQHLWLSAVTGLLKLSGHIRKGATRRAAPLLSNYCRILHPELGQVITEGGFHHVVNRLRRDGRCTGGYSARTRPAHFVDVGVLNTPLNAALFALVKLVPEAERAFPDVSNIASACAAYAGSSRSRGYGFRGAPGIVSQGRAIAADAIRCGGKGGRSRDGG